MFFFEQTVFNMGQVPQNRGFEGFSTWKTQIVYNVPHGYMWINELDKNVEKPTLSVLVFLYLE